jgi:hypothetical protein
MTPLHVPIVVRHARGPERRLSAEPITVGVPFPRGVLGDVSRLALLDETGAAVPCQATIAERWVDGSARWAHVDFQSRGPAAERVFDLTTVAEPSTGRGRALAISRTGDAVTVDTGVARFRMEPRARTIFAEVSGSGILASGPLGAIALTSEDGREWPVHISRVSIEREGPIQCEVRLEGTVGPDGDPLVDAIVRVNFFAGSATTKIAVTLRNPRAAEHPGGFWELGSGGAVYMRDVSVRFQAASPAYATLFAAEIGDDLRRVDGRIAIQQESSGGEQWRSLTHVSRSGEIPFSVKGYKVSGALTAEGLRATPCAILSEGPRAIGLSAQHFWENFPKALEAEPAGLVFRLWPAGSELHELQGGEQKTHEFVLIGGGDPVSLDAPTWSRRPALAASTPEWYAAAGALHHLRPRRADVDPRYGTLVNAAIEGDDSFFAKRERIDEFGWRHFGDVYADHENAFSAEGGSIVSHYNNQYDVIGGSAAQFFRTGDERWWTLMDDAARHVADIDIYHTDRDKPAYNHGLFWHTFHYVPAGKSSHRSYPRHPKVWGGGPANEHNYATGLRLHWLLTASTISRDAVLELAQWVIEMDDGRRTVLRWLSRAPTGLASATQSPDYHGPGRGAGHSIQALIDGHRVSGGARYLRKADELIRRCVHPADDIASRRLLEAELRWSYVVFMQSLGKYLDHKADLGEDDDAASYARASLLHYARWMAEHEYPYLQKPEILEYPTETWAAQDMRKAEVFLYAARYGRAEERERFLDRARYFFDESLTTLAASETRTLARPMVLLLSNGFMVAGFDAARAAWSSGESKASFSPARPFVRQKTAAKKRLLGAAAVFVTVLLLLLVTLFLY